MIVPSSSTNSANIDSAKLMTTIRSVRIRREEYRLKYESLGKGIEQLEQKLQKIDPQAYYQLLLENAASITGPHARIQPDLSIPPRSLQKTHITEMPTTRLPTTGSMNKLPPPSSTAKKFTSKNICALAGTVTQYIREHGSNALLEVHANRINFNYLALLGYERVLVLDESLDTANIVCISK